MGQVIKGLVADSGNENIRILLIDHQRLVTDAITIYLNAQPRMTVMAANDMTSAVDILRREEPFDLVLLDWNMPGTEGADAMRRLMNVSPSSRFAGLVTTLSAYVRERVLALGGAGVIAKTYRIQTLANAIRFMAAGEIYINAEVVVPAQRKTDTSCKISPREFEILTGIMRGEQNKVIAGRLSLAETTIKMHVQNLCRKLGVTNRTQAALRARDIGLH